MPNNTVTNTYYVHGPPYEDNFAPFWPIEDERQTKMHYLLYEESVEVEIDLDTGEHRILGFAGKKLEEPTDWSDYFER